MKTLKTLATIAITSLISLGVQAQTTQRLNASKANDYGLIYSLPRTLVDITTRRERKWIATRGRPALCGC